MLGGIALEKARLVDYPAVRAVVTGFGVVCCIDIWHSQLGKESG